MSLIHSVNFTLSNYMNVFTNLLAFFKIRRQTFVSPKNALLFLKVLYSSQLDTAQSQFSRIRKAGQSQELSFNQEL